jgi:lipopolysaccharide transport system ATP-binding protein
MRGLPQRGGGLVMSSESIITVDGVSKAFPIYEKPYHRLMQMLSPRAQKKRWFREFHALRNVDFEIGRGETLGIVGRNGSGKSTLLQIICGTLAPSSGSVVVNGRVAALLELGAGFNPEFTGRENVYLNGTVLGLTRSEIEQRYDEILSFADIGEFIEQPVKSYSSGMYIRLAFAVAINVMPDVLVIDEALSVGDEAFQRKCFARIQRIKDAGATVLFVSHSAGTVTELCDRAILLDRGELIAQGAPKFVVSRYHKLLYAPVDRAFQVREQIREDTIQVQGEAALVRDADESDAALVRGALQEVVVQEDYMDAGLIPQSTVRYSDRGAHIEDAHIETVDGRPVNVLIGGGRYVYTYRVRFDCDSDRVRFGMMIKTVTGVELGGGASQAQAIAGTPHLRGEVVFIRFQFRCMLAPGVYFLNAGVLSLVDGEEIFLDRYLDVAMFRVLPDPDRLATGVVDFSIVPSVNRQSVVKI